MGDGKGPLGSQTPIQSMQIIQKEHICICYCIICLATSRCVLGLFTTPSTVKFKVCSLVTSCPSRFFMIFPPPSCNLPGCAPAIASRLMRLGLPSKWVTVPAGGVSLSSRSPSTISQVPQGAGMEGTGEAQLPTRGRSWEGIKSTSGEGPQGEQSGTAPPVRGVGPLSSCFRGRQQPEKQVWAAMVAATAKQKTEKRPWSGDNRNVLGFHGGLWLLDMLGLSLCGILGCEVCNQVDITTAFCLNLLMSGTLKMLRRNPSS